MIGTDLHAALPLVVLDPKSRTEVCETFPWLHLGGALLSILMFRAVFTWVRPVAGCVGEGIKHMGPKFFRQFLIALKADFPTWIVIVFAHNVLR